MQDNSLRQKAANLGKENIVYVAINNRYLTYEGTMS